MMVEAEQAPSPRELAPQPLALAAQPLALEPPPAPLLLLPTSPGPAVGLGELENAAQGVARSSRRTPFKRPDSDEELGSGTDSEGEGDGAAVAEASVSSAGVPRAEASLKRRRNVAGKHSSTHVGVSWHRSSKRWQATIRIEGKQKFLGCFVDEEAAAKAYQEAAMSRAEAASKAEQAVAEEALADLPASFVATSAATRLPVAPASAAPAVAPAEEGKCTSERQSGKRCTAQSRLPVVAGTDNDGRPFKYCVEHKCTSVGCWKARFAAARLCRLCKTVPPGGELLKTLTPLFAPGAAAAMPAQAAVAPMPGHVTVPTPTQPFMLAQLAASPHPPPHLGALPSLGALPLPMPMPMLMPMTMHMPMPMPVQQVGALPPMPASSSDKSRRYTSQFPGVCWNKSKNKWKSQIYEGGTMRHIGSFDDELAAAKAYEVAVAKGFAAAVEELRPASSRKKGSKYLGVALCKQRGPNKKPWKAQIWFNSKAYSLGNHESELTAAEAYAAAAARVRAGTFNPGDPRGLRDGFDPEETAPPGSGPDDASDVM